MNNYITNGLWLANMHAECRTEVSENKLRAHLMKAVARTHELAKQRDELEKLCNYNERVLKELLQQRDELHAALKRVAAADLLDHSLAPERSALAIARDALAKVGAARTAEPDCDRSACGDFSPGRCDNPDCSALRPPTPTGWSDTDWLKHLQEQPHPLAGMHINQGSMDAAAGAYEAEYKAAHECSTCSGLGTIDERLGGEWNSNPKAECPDCDGAGELRHNAEITGRASGPG